nr:acireductone dioxygenase [Azospirillum picis]
MTVFLEHDAQRPELTTSDPALAAAHLAHVGVLFERLQPDRPLSPGADAEAVLAAYAAPVARLREARRFASVDVIRVTPEMPEAAALRGKFLEEHTHDEDEARLFVEGAGAFFIHTADRVIRVVCGAGDLLSVPAGAPHWFDMGIPPRFTAIRFFTRPDGWVAQPTGNPIAARFPQFAPKSCAASQAEAGLP